MNKDVRLYCMVVDDEPLAQQVVENYIQQLSEVKLVAKCENTEEAYSILTSRPIDIIVLDLDLKTSGGLDLISRMDAEMRQKCFIVITTAAYSLQFDIESLRKKERIQLVDFFLKPFSFERFRESIEKIKKLRATN